MLFVVDSNVLEERTNEVSLDGWEGSQVWMREPAVDHGWTRICCVPFLCSLMSFGLCFVIQLCAILGLKSVATQVCADQCPLASVWFFLPPSHSKFNYDFVTVTAEVKSNSCFINETAEVKSNSCFINETAEVKSNSYLVTGTAEVKGNSHLSGKLDSSTAVPWPCHGVRDSRWKTGALSCSVESAVVSRSLSRKDLVGECVAQPTS